MTRLSLSVVAVALATGCCLAEPIGEHMSRFRDMAATQTDGEVPTYSENAVEDTTNNETTATPAETPSPAMPVTGPQQLLYQLPKLLGKQLQLQDSLMTKIMRDVEEYMKATTESFQWGDTQSAAITRVNEMMEMIGNRMSTAINGAGELMANSEHLDTESLRRATSNFMKEVRVQDVVIDSLWASLRGVQTSSWMTGSPDVEKEDTAAVANRAAEDFLARMYHNLRSAGISEEDIVKFVPKTETEESEPGRKMGRRGRGYGYGYYYGYGYPTSYSRYGSGYLPAYSSYSWGYPTYSSYPWGYYPSYRSYGYLYPSYSSSWGYPSYSYSWGSPSYSSWYYRRLGSASCPDCPPAFGDMTNQIVPPFRGLGEDLMIGTTPVTPQGLGDLNSQFYNTFEGQRYSTLQNMGYYPFEGMSGLNVPTVGNTGFSYEMTPMTGYRNLAPVPEMPGVLPQGPMFTPTTGLPW